MALNSINTNIAAMNAQSNIGRASTMAGSSIARLSSGNRIVRAADDVAAMSAGTSLRTNVTTLKMAMVNTAQGSSLLQVADGALAQVTDILQRQKAIAVQAGSGSLTSAERSFLNQEFQNLTQEIDRLAKQTNFNGVSLLDGALFDTAPVQSANKEATKGTITLTIGAVADGNLITFNNPFGANAVVFEIEDTSAANGLAAATNIAINIDLTVVTTAEARAQVIASALNNSSLGFSASAVGADVILRESAGSSFSSGLVLDATGTTAGTVSGQRTYTDAAGAALGTVVHGFNNGADYGIGRGDTRALGTIGDSAIATQRQLFVSEGVNFAGANFAEGNILRFDDGVGGNVEFMFIDSDGASRTPATTPTATANHIGIEIREFVTAVAEGGDIDAARGLVMDRIVEAINNYKDLSRTATGGIVGNANSSVANGANNEDADFVISQIEARREGSTVVFSNRQAGGLRQVNGTTALAAMTVNVAGAAVTGTGTFDIDGTNILLNSGVNVNGITNEAFTGTISGFQVDYRASNVVDISIKVGDRTYRASSVDVSRNYGVNTQNNPPTASQNFLKFISEAGDSFTMDLQGQTQNITVNNQLDARTLASRLDKAFSSLTFVQDREIESYTGAGDIIVSGVKTGTLTGSGFSLQTGTFDGKGVQDIRVKAPVAGGKNASIEFDISGATYRADIPLGNTLGAYGVFKFVSLENGNDVLTFNTGESSISIKTAEEALALQNALKDAFGVGTTGAALKFQVGTTTQDTLSISIGSVTTTKIYGGLDLNVLTAESAALAADALDAAIDMVTSVRAEVGALQSRFDFAAANVESSIANQDAARGVLLDTDIAAESTAFSTAQVQLQAGISVLAQANLLPQNLLKLIG